MRKFNQNGTGVIELVLLIVVIAILGFTGWFVWHARQNANTAYTNTDHSSVTAVTSVKNFADCKKAAGSKILTTFPEQCMTKSGQMFTDPSQAALSQQYLTIKEWGVQFQLPDALKDAYYGATGNNSPNAFGLGLQSLTKLSAECAPDKITLGLLSRQTAAEHDANQVDQAQNGADESNSVYGVKVGDYYYGYIHAQAGCFEVPSPAATLYDQIKPDVLFKQAVQTLRVTS